MSDNENKTDTRADAAAAAAKRKEEMLALSQSVGKTFTDGQATARIYQFVEDKGIGPKRGPAYLINMGNPYRSNWVFCEDFNNTFTTETKG